MRAGHPYDDCKKTSPEASRAHFVVGNESLDWIMDRSRDNYLKMLQWLHVLKSMVAAMHASKPLRLEQSAHNERTSARRQFKWAARALIARRCYPPGDGSLTAFMAKPMESESLSLPASCQALTALAAPHPVMPSDPQALLSQMMTATC